jgi:predicted ArsR family transcriptional regulator
MTSNENASSPTPQGLEQSRRETRAAFENRALMYAYIYDELAAELGEERATEILKRAIRRRGLEIGAKYRDAASRGDLEEVARIFVEGSPAAGSLFEPGVEEEPTEGRLVLRMTSCPLVDAWEAAGYDAGYIDHLCEVAAEVDHGTFEGAGLELVFIERQPEPGGCRCLLELTVPSAVVDD